MATVTVLPSSPPQDPVTKMGDIVTELQPTSSTLTVPPPKDKRAYTSAEVARHNMENDLWIVVKGEIYDMTEFQHDHPGGKKLIQKVGGKDATKQFQKYHRDGLLLIHEDKVVGRVNDVVQKKGLFGFLKK